MKSGVAVFAAAACAFVARRALPTGSIGFLITGDEEGPAINGTEKLLRWAYDKGERFDHCIVGEPTSFEVLGDTIKTGRQGHAAYPARADNPIPKLMRLLAALTSAPLDKGTAHFEPSNLEIVSVDVGNPAFNVIPAEARARFNIRFNDLWTPETLAAELRRRLERPSWPGLTRPSIKAASEMPGSTPGLDPGAGMTQESRATAVGDTRSNSSLAMPRPF